MASLFDRPLRRRALVHPLALGLGLISGLGLVGIREARAAERPALEPRPATWDMSLEELRAVGLGQSRGRPVPVPPEYPRLNADPRPAEGGPLPPWIIFVNFDGETLSAGADSAQSNVTQVPGMGGDFAPYGQGAKRDAVIQAVIADWAAYNMEIVDERPTEGEYVMNMTGPTNPFGPGVLGIAPLDCMNMQTHSNITFAFHSVDDEFSAPITATTIGQEVAHSFGLEHVDEPSDIMNPYNAGGDPAFLDECIPITGGPVTCPEQHAAHCDGFAQNAHQELLAMFGPAYVDVDPPTVVILSPYDGMEFVQAPATVPVTAAVVDDTEIAGVTLRNNGMVVSTLTEEPWAWTLEDLGEGVWTLEVSAVDTSGNEGLSVPVVVTVGSPGGTGGDTEGETDGLGQDGDGKGCGSFGRRAGSGWGWERPLSSSA
ncbi:MAG: hypothetical protein KDK70_16090, partial [Myxococcales bacterium]|nr:hypothetical protein [Myxococcales bacterium]